MGGSFRWLNPGVTIKSRLGFNPGQELKIFKSASDTARSQNIGKGGQPDHIDAGHINGALHARITSPGISLHVKMLLTSPLPECVVIQKYRDQVCLRCLIKSGLLRLRGKVSHEIYISRVRGDISKKKPPLLEAFCYILRNYFLNFAYLFLNLSIRPAVSSNWLFPV